LPPTFSSRKTGRFLAHHIEAAFLDGWNAVVEALGRR
jgi:hypothetical protein